MAETDVSETSPTIPGVRKFLHTASFVTTVELQPLLTKLTSSAVPFTWTPEAEEAFRELKRCFTSAPVLVQPDPSRQFIVEVDASDTGVSAVLSLRSGSDQKLHPSAFLSHQLNPA